MYHHRFYYFLRTPFASNLGLHYIQPFGDTQPAGMGSRCVPSCVLRNLWVFPLFTRPLLSTPKIATSKPGLHPSQPQAFFMASLRSPSCCGSPMSLFVPYTVRFICALLRSFPRVFSVSSAIRFPWDPRFESHISRAFPVCFCCDFARSVCFPSFLLYS